MHRVVKGAAVRIDTAARDINRGLDIAVRDTLMDGLARVEI